MSTKVDFWLKIVAFFRVIFTILTLIENNPGNGNDENPLKTHEALHREH